MISCEIVVNGKVQGVGFRRFVFNHARQFNISGYVKNRFTSDVYILATGEELNINLFVDKIKQGSFFSRVKDVSLAKIPLDDKYKGFSIK